MVLTGATSIGRAGAEGFGYARESLPVYQLTECGEPTAIELSCFQMRPAADNPGCGETWTRESLHLLPTTVRSHDLKQLHWLLYFDACVFRSARGISIRLVRFTGARHKKLSNHAQALGRVKKNTPTSAVANTRA